MGISLIPLAVVAMVPIITGSFGCAVGKRSTTSDDIANIDYPDYSPKYEDYPVSKKIRRSSAGLARTTEFKIARITSVVSDITFPPV